MTDIEDYDYKVYRFGKTENNSIPKSHNLPCVRHDFVLGAKGLYCANCGARLHLGKVHDKNKQR